MILTEGCVHDLVGGLDLLAYDLIVHIGLGVYDGHSTLMCDRYKLLQPRVK